SLLCLQAIVDYVGDLLSSAVVIRPLLHGRSRLQEHGLGFIGSAELAVCESHWCERNDCDRRRNGYECTDHAFFLPVRPSSRTRKRARGQSADRPRERCGRPPTAPTLPLIGGTTAGPGGSSRAKLKRLPASHARPDDAPTYSGDQCIARISGRGRTHLE